MDEDPDLLEKMKHLENLLSKGNKWIDSEEFVPPHQEIVLVADEFNEFVTLGRYDITKDLFLVMNIDLVEIDSQVTHWMPLPKLPSVNHE